jgi:hypothetical protein
MCCLNSDARRLHGGFAAEQPTLNTNEIYGCFGVTVHGFPVNFSLFFLNFVWPSMSGCLRGYPQYNDWL